MVGVVNRQMGIAAYSPRLDAKCNSVRGKAAFRQLSDELGLHAFEWSNYGSQYLRASAE
jgi:glutaminase